MNNNYLNNYLNNPDITFFKGTPDFGRTRTFTIPHVPSTFERVAEEYPHISFEQINESIEQEKTRSKVDTTYIMELLAKNYGIPPTHPKYNELFCNMISLYFSSLKKTT